MQMHASARAQLGAFDAMFYCIGAQRSGTTWLYRQLSKAPDIHMPSKEVHYWDSVRAPYRYWDDMGQGSARSVSARLRPVLQAIRHRDPGAYRAERARLAMRQADPADASAYATYLCQNAGAARIVGDMTPSYALCAASTFSEMAGLHDRTRFLFLMRDPVDRFLSGLALRYRGSLAYRHDSATRARLIEEALNDPHNPDLRRSRYDETLTRLYDAVPRDCVLPVFFEDLFTQSTMDGICDFLGMSRLVCDATTKVNAWPGTSLTVPDALVDLVENRLAGTYHAVAHRLGDLPRAWRRPPQGAEIVSLNSHAEQEAM
ncbi:MAG: sulfotransferase [Rhodobacteraceae bacterium]|nr:sulfotransferase [Paracoccaceae bacterium]